MLPEGIGNLKKLRALVASNNKLKALPPSLKELASLEFLYLHGNPLLALPAEVMGSKLSGYRWRPFSPSSSPMDRVTKPIDMQHVQMDFPAEWFQIKERLAEMKEPFISFTQYRKICVGLGEKDTVAQERLASFLNALNKNAKYSYASSAMQRNADVCWR